VLGPALGELCPLRCGAGAHTPLPAQAEQAPSCRGAAQGVHVSHQKREGNSGLKVSMAES
jgi:hypothetical protein